MLLGELLRLSETLYVHIIYITAERIRGSDECDQTPPGTTSSPHPQLIFFPSQLRAGAPAGRESVSHRCALTASPPSLHPAHSGFAPSFSS